MFNVCEALINVRLLIFKQVIKHSEKTGPDKSSFFFIAIREMFK
jgi:hypothetical protein